MSWWVAYGKMDWNPVDSHFNLMGLSRNLDLVIKLLIRTQIDNIHVSSFTNPSTIGHF